MAACAIATIVLAGSTTGQVRKSALLDSINAGIVSEEIIDRRVREILRVRMTIKPVPDDEANKQMTSQPAQQIVAYEVASRSIVLL
ncbi:MAG: hypothetical protein MUE37_11430 [Bacteroidales bacterium]|jgi:beta-glucosidase|nr:hypothetical protein [Bacteroidales bacterium]